MNIDVAKAVKELLFERDSVILPGLGAFIGKSAASEVDYVQGAVQPPTKKLEFNTNIVINDGVLINYIQKDSLVTGQEAKMAIEEYVAKVKKALEQKEIVDIPEIGRLYRDYEQKIRFMPEGTNFETDSFGLPNVKFHPVMRRKTTAQTGTAQPGTASQNTPPTPPNVPPSHTIPKVTKTVKKSWAEEWLPWLFALAAVLLAITMFFSLRGCGEDGGQQANVPPERINVKPTDKPQDEESDLTTSEMENETDAKSLDDSTEDGGALTPPTYRLDDKKTDNATDSGPKADAASDKPIFVVVHSFGSRDNAKAFARQLEKAGYTPVEKKFNGLRRVGVEVPYNRRSEVDDLINELGRKFDAKPVVVEY